MNFKHSGALGDIIYSLPIIKKKWQDTGEKHNLYLELDVRSISYPAKKNWLLFVLFRIPEKINFELNKRGKKGFKLDWWYDHFYPRVYHPAKNVRMNKWGYDSLYDLLLAQSYIKSVDVYSGQNIDVDLDSFRQLDIDFFNTEGDLAEWHIEATGIQADLYTAWLSFEYDEKYKDKVVWGRSARVRNETIDFSILKNISNLIFVGLENEYEDMKKIVPNLVYQKTENAKELASIIGSCKVYIGNSSFPFALAEAIKVSRLFEECDWCKTVQPKSNGYKFTNQAEFKSALSRFNLL